MSAKDLLGVTPTRLRKIKALKMGHRMKLCEWVNEQREIAGLPVYPEDDG